MPRGDQLTRQWRLISLLAGRAGRTLAQLSGELSVTKRTIQRDLAAIESAGIPVTSTPRNGTVFWRLMEGFHAEAPVSLSLTEQMALYFSKGLLRPLQGSPMYESLESAFRKIGSQIPPQGFRFLAGLDKAISVSTFGLKDYTRSKQVIEALTRAVFHRFTAWITHRAPQREEASERRVDPYRLWYVNNGLYLMGHDHLKNGLRVFAVERILSVKTTNQRFELPEDFNFERLTEAAFNMVWGEAQQVKIRFSPLQAPYIRERTWHPSQRIDAAEDGSLVLTLKVADLGEVKRWLIGFGSEAEVLEPHELAEEIAREARQLARQPTI
jgi:predicted DNA-binding transcriptional regulator YafY